MGHSDQFLHDVTFFEGAKGPFRAGQSKGKARVEESEIKIEVIGKPRKGERNTRAAEQWKRDTADVE